MKKYFFQIFIIMSISLFPQNNSEKDIYSVGIIDLYISPVLDGDFREDREFIETCEHLHFKNNLLIEKLNEFIEINKEVQCSNIKRKFFVRYYLNNFNSIDTITFLNFDYVKINSKYYIPTDSLMLFFTQELPYDFYHWVMYSEKKIFKKNNKSN